MFPMQRKSPCLPKEAVGRAIFDLIYRKADKSAPSAVSRGSGRTHAGFDIIAGYARNCGRRLRLNATKTFLPGDDPVLCAIRENIRKAVGVHANAAADANGAKEIDCYV